jgi:starch-binding outer membrane protein, SusD/RagB family
MHSKLKTFGVFLALAGVAGCGDFLTGPGLTESPNFPVTIEAEQLLVSTQARMFVQQEGQLARTAAIWTQQIAGINNQQRDYGSRYEYTELAINTPFDGIYQSGGLIDLRRLQQLAAADGNSRIQAFGMIIEGLSMGTYASLWGDLPYRQAVDPAISSPELDPQQQIYADVQSLLSEAIGLLQNAPTTPLGQDLIYNGDPARWIAAANTLKARFSLHVAPQVGSSAYQDALTFAAQGINEAPGSAAAAMHGQGPGDFRALHGSTLNADANLWGQFLEERADIVANTRMLEILEQRNDPRLAAYHAEVDGGGYSGGGPFGTTTLADEQPWSFLNATDRVGRDFRQPFITWAENQLIKAEANFQLGNTGAALGNVNDVRTAIGMAPLAGPVTLEDIMVEKWIAQFQNIDVYADWRRTCYPRLIPGGQNDPTPAARVPGRYVYGQTERQQNPNFSNLTPAQQPEDNWATTPTQPCPAGNTGGERYPV